ncbi:hypothetical protein MnTg03_01083 [bacterium MnTg03]|nr:hypothetical protein MnTg03_01083 [bacterium MnTg03]
MSAPRINVGRSRQRVDTPIRAWLSASQVCDILDPGNCNRPVSSPRTYRSALWRTSSQPIKAPRKLSINVPTPRFAVIARSRAIIAVRNAGNCDQASLTNQRPSSDFSGKKELHRRKPRASKAGNSHAAANNTKASKIKPSVVLSIRRYRTAAQISSSRAPTARLRLAPDSESSTATVEFADNTLVFNCWYRGQASAHDNPNRVINQALNRVSNCNSIMPARDAS